MDNMNMTENTRIIRALRSIGWNDTDINNLVLYMEDDDKQALKDLQDSKKQNNQYI